MFKIKVKKIMKYNAKNIFKIIVILMLIGLANLFFANTLYAASKSSCQKPTKCPTNCAPAHSGNYFTTSCSSQVNASCAAKATSSTSGGSCFNSVPVSSVTSISPQCYRSNGAGGDSTPRNHYGSDLGGGGKSDILVYAAADGVVKYAKTSGGGGRTIQIEHTKNCSGAKSNKYKTTYRHLLSYKVSVGQTVKKDQPIGVEGGSNAKALGAQPCDNQAQAGKIGYTRAGCGQNYSIHLHFEVA